VAGSKKRPKAAKAPPPSPRRPRTIANLIADSGAYPRPVFSFAKVDRNYQGTWGWHLLREEHDLFGLLCDLSQSTWVELWAHTAGAHRKHHWQPISTLVPEAQNRLTTLQWDDMEDIFRFRQGAKHRLWGFEIRGMFYAVWWDPDHKVYEVDPDD